MTKILSELFFNFIMKPDFFEKWNKLKKLRFDYSPNGEDNGSSYQRT
jgi:hypothetical protein